MTNPTHDKPHEVTPLRTCEHGIVYGDPCKQCQASADGWGMGPEGWSDVVAYVNDTPALGAMLVELGLYEQVKHSGHGEEAADMIFTIANHWRERELAINAVRSAGRPSISEEEAQRLAAISVAAMSNTRESAAKNKLDRYHPWWTAAYGDVLAAVEREMALREQLESAPSSARPQESMWNPTNEEIDDAHKDLKRFFGDGGAGADWGSQRDMAKLVAVTRRAFRLKVDDTALSASADSKDAARYRRIRQSPAWYDAHGRKLWGEELDAAVDAAIARSEGRDA